MKIKTLFATVFMFSLLLTATGLHAENPGKLLRHVVMFKFKDNATTENIQKVEQEFAKLSQKVGGIRSYEWGTNCSPEKLNQGLTHCFILTFTSEKDRNAYLVHPAHKDFGKMLEPYVDKVTVLDFWVK